MWSDVVGEGRPCGLTLSYKRSVLIQNIRFEIRVMNRIANRTPDRAWLRRSSESTLFKGLSCSYSHLVQIILVVKAISLSEESTDVYTQTKSASNQNNKSTLKVEDGDLLTGSKRLPTR